MEEVLQDIRVVEWEESTMALAPALPRWQEVDEEGKRLLLEAGN